MQFYIGDFTQEPSSQTAEYSDFLDYVVESIVTCKIKHWPAATMLWNAVKSKFYIWANILIMYSLNWAKNSSAPFKIKQ